MKEGKHVTLFHLLHAS